MEFHEASSSAPSTIENDSKTPQKNKISEPDSSTSPKKKYYTLTDPAFSTSNVLLPTLKPFTKPNLHRND